MIGWNIKQLLGKLDRLSPDISTVSMTSYVPASILSERLSSGGNLSVAPGLFVREAIKHRGYAKPIDVYSVETLAETLADRLEDGLVRGFCSKVQLLNGAESHLPLLDFHCSVSCENSAAIQDAMKLMGQKRGALVVSGKSYHYYGFDPMGLVEWRRFMARSILLSPMIDTRYLAHCLIEDLACLRIDARPNENAEPVVAAILE